jgi:hypothetical protein
VALLSGAAATDTSLFWWLTVLAGLCVLNAALMATRKRMHDLACFVHVLGGADLLLLALAGPAIAVAGTLRPASWAARSRTSAVLYTEITA